jgi:hypothetical protein
MDLRKPAKLIKDLKQAKFLPVYDEGLLKELLDDMNKHYFPVLRQTLK